MAHQTVNKGEKMKIRSGFVSNSSSSSFVIVCKEEDHKQVLKTLHPYYKQWISQLTPAKQKFAGIDILVFSMFISREDEEAMAWEGEYPKEAEEYCGYNEDDTEKTEKYVPCSTIIDIYVGKLKKISSEVVFEQMSC